MYKLYYVMYSIYDVIYKLCDVMYKLYDVLYELYMVHTLHFIMYQLLYMRKLLYMMWINRPSENKCYICFHSVDLSTSYMKFYLPVLSTSRFAPVH